MPESWGACLVVAVALVLPPHSLGQEFGVVEGADGKAGRIWRACQRIGQR